MWCRGGRFPASLSDQSGTFHTLSAQRDSTESAASLPYPLTTPGKAEGRRALFTRMSPSLPPCGPLCSHTYDERRRGRWDKCER